jgi:hypothetical protein
MKTLLAILLSFAVTEAPVLAIHGGYTLGGTAGVNGTYAGVLIPTADTSLVSGTGGTNFGTNALGIFTLGIPTTGIGSGTVFIFASGQQLAGTIQALASPAADGGIVGIIQATGQLTEGTFSDIFGDTITETEVTGEASGGLSVTVDQSTQSVSTSGINISGTASVVITTSYTTPTTTAPDGATTGGQTNFIPTEDVVFDAEGFQQSDYAAPTTTTAQ